jgi:hypothetical protein
MDFRAHLVARDELTSTDSLTTEIDECIIAEYQIEPSEAEMRVSLFSPFGPGGVSTIWPSEGA